MIILGIDPGTARTGYGIIKKMKGTRQSKVECLGFGLIETDPSFSPAERLKILNNKLNKVIKEYRPKVLALEKVYFFKNLKTAIPVSQASGVIMLTAAKKKIPVFQYTPLQVKLTITGYGWAEKKEVQKKIKNLLKLDQIRGTDDVADALAIALTYFLIKKA